MAHRKRRKLKAEINVVPYIDVMLVLLIIFMVTAPLLTLSINVDLPVSNSKALESKQDPIVVIAYSDHTFGLQLPKDKSPEKMKATELTAKLTAVVFQDRSVRVIVASDAKVPYEYVIAAIDAIKDANVDKVGLLTKPSGANAR
ncbi:MAG TPA: ExbD/TolR family protein [Xylella sp.]